MNLLMKYGMSLVTEQDNVKRVQLAEEYISGAALAGTDGSSIPEGYEGSVGTVNNAKKPLWTPPAKEPVAAATPSWQSSYPTPAPPAPAAKTTKMYDW